MSYFTELTCVSSFVLAVPASSTSDDRMKLVNTINDALREAMLELRRSDVNFLPLEVVTSLRDAE
jgi:hypothetical protein